MSTTLVMLPYELKFSRITSCHLLKGILPKNIFCLKSSYIGHINSEDVDGFQ